MPKHSNSRAAAIVRERRRTATRPAGTETLSAHCLIAGLDADTAGGVAGALRSKAKQLGIKPEWTGRTHYPVGGCRAGDSGHKVCRYSAVQFAELVAAYNPRAARYVAARTKLMSGRH